MRSKACPDEVRAAVLDALSEAVGWPGRVVAARGLVETGRGPAFLIVGWSVDMPDWLEHFAAALDTRGVVGSITPAVQGWGRAPDWEPRGGISTIGLCATVHYPTPRAAYIAAGRRSLDLWPDDPQGADIVQAACAWACRETDETVFGVGIKRGYPVRSDPGSHVAALTGYFGRGVAVEAKTLAVPRQRRLAFRSPHEIDVSLYDPTAGWRAQVDDLRAIFDWFPASIDLATIYIAWSGGWDSAIPPTSVGLQRADLFRFIPDIRGLQLVTTAHLDKCTDLTGWTVTQRAPDRYLLEADDLEPWYSGTSIDPDTLANARDQFRPLLITGQPPGTFLRPETLPQPE